MKICKLSQAALALVIVLSLASASTLKSEFVEVSQRFTGSDRVSLSNILGDIDAEMIWADIDKSGTKLTVKVYNYYSADSKTAPTKTILNQLGTNIKSLVENKYDVNRIEFQFLEEGQLSSDYQYCVKGC
ncbi:hypothetical protein [Reichenbachiella versicolor]|uniref:hypothetical protein n=1 Tax=Reichenbachiella versicolor TaxID=1821036 RepID=UPI000D6E57A0|nr:hypothetical protein [Reichenbachiella versicolor]